MSAHYLLQNQSNEVSLLAQRATELARTALAAEFLPWALLPLAVWLARRFLTSYRPRWRWLLALWLALQLWVSLACLGGFPFSGDETSYLFQARLLAHAQLKAVPLGSLSPFFQSPSVILNEGGCYSKYQVGWPALLALGEWLHQPAVVNAFLNAGSLCLLWRLGRYLQVPACAWLPALALSPFFLFNGGSYGVHPSSLFFTLLFLTASSGGAPLALGGLALVALCQIRVVDLLLAVLAGWSLARQRFSWYATVAGSLALGLGLLGLCNWLQNGSPLQMGFTLYDPSDRWGLGAHGHSPLRAFWNQFYSLARWQAWMPASWPLFVLLGLTRGGSRCWKLALAAAAQLLFYSLYFTLGVVEYGPRYWYNANAVLALVAGAGCAGLAASLERRWPGGRWLPALGVTLAAQALLSSAFLFPRVGAEVGAAAQVLRDYREALGQAGPCLVLVQPAGGARAQDWNRFDSPYWDDRVLFTSFLHPRENQRLIEAFPGRTVLTMKPRRGPQGMVFEVSSYSSLAPAATWLAAGESYLDLGDTARARDCFLELLKLEPANPHGLTYLGRLSAQEGDLEQAVACYQKVLAVEPNWSDVRYALALNLEKLGRVREAAEQYTIVAREQPDGPEGQRAAAWLSNH